MINKIIQLINNIFSFTYIEIKYLRVAKKEHYMVSLIFLRIYYLKLL